MIKNRKRETYIDTANGKILNKVMDYYENGNIDGEYYYFNGKCHREDGPAIIKYKYSYISNNDKLEELCREYHLNGIRCDILQEAVIQGLEAEREIYGIKKR